MERNAEVGELQEAIFDKERFERQYDFAPSDLTLNLARKNGSWLKHDRGVDNNLLLGDVDTEYKEMLPSWRLSNPTLLGPDFQLREGELHVLVQLPDVPKRRTVDPCVMELHEPLLRHVLLGAETQSLTHAIRRRTLFQARLVYRLRLQRLGGWQDLALHAAGHGAAV